MNGFQNKNMKNILCAFVFNPPPLVAPPFAAISTVRLLWYVSTSFADLEFLQNTLDYGTLVSQ
ncbi:MAG: hypothetical protein ACRC4N_03015 [Gammaproteobacteria bacterium]